MWDFEKNSVVDSLDSVPEKYRGLYAEITEGDEAGKFAIADHAKGIVADYSGAMASLTGERGKGKKLGEENAQRRLANKAFEELCESLGLEEDSRSAEGLKAFIDDLVGKAKNGEELKVSIESVRKEMQKKHAAELEAKDKEIAGRDGALERYLVTAQASQEIASRKGKPKVLMPHIKSVTKVVRDPETGDYHVRVLGEDGEVRYNGSGAPMTMGELVEDLRGDPDYGACFESETKGGGGMPPGGGHKGPVKPAGKELSSTQKIAAGIAKGQHTGGPAGKRYGMGS